MWHSFVLRIPATLSAGLILTAALAGCGTSSSPTGGSGGTAGTGGTAGAGGTAGTGGTAGAGGT
ncbi:MAG: hypothetical protein WBG86_17140, partial [Polyangiales bacterium]